MYLSREEVELEYYDKLARFERWHRIRRTFEEAKCELLRDYRKCPGCYRTEEYCAECHEEQGFLNGVMSKVKEILEGPVHAGLGRYTMEKPVRPNHLP